MGYFCSANQFQKKDEPKNLRKESAPEIPISQPYMRPPEAATMHVIMTDAVNPRPQSPTGPLTAKAVPGAISVFFLFLSPSPNPNSTLFLQSNQLQWNWLSSNLLSFSSQLLVEGTSQFFLIRGYLIVDQWLLFRGATDLYQYVQTPFRSHFESKKNDWNC